MITCSNCGSEAAEADRFCGDCGAPLGVGEPPAAPAQIPQEGGLGARRRSPWAFTAALSTLALIAVGAGSYYLFASEYRPGKAIRLAIGDLPFTSDDPESGEATPTPSDSSSEAADETETPSAAPEVVPTVSGAPGTPPQADAAPADGAILPGSWVFGTLLYNVTKVDMSDTSFRLNREGIGLSEPSSQCVTPSVAANPGASAFPFRPGMDCRASSFSMAGNRYRAVLTCNFPQYGGRRPVEADGQYSANDISVNLRVRVPAQIVNGDFANPPEIYLHYRISGRRTQPSC